MIQSYKVQKKYHRQVTCLDYIANKKLTSDSCLRLQMCGDKKCWVLDVSTFLSLEKLHQAIRRSPSCRRRMTLLLSRKLNNSARCLWGHQEKPAVDFVLVQLIASAVYKIERIGCFSAEEGYPATQLPLPHKGCRCALCP